jgi:hypothetical protein
MSHLKGILLFLIPLTITYAIISDLGKPQHNYRAPDSIGVSDQGLPQHNVN